MLNKIKNRKQEGFTIIEVLIVLAIAGLILLIVFLAVPALQRNSRNTTKKNDVSKALASTNEWVANNSGKIPSSATDATSIQTAAGLSTGVSVTIVAKKAGITAAPTRDEIIIVTGVQCSNSGVITVPSPTPANMQDMVTDAASRAYAAIYVIEASGSNFTTQCQGS